MNQTRMRLNGVIRKLEGNQLTFGAFLPPEPSVTISMASSQLDTAIFELEHHCWDANALRVALQFMLDRSRIVQSGSIAPSVTPFVRIPANGGEMNQWLAKQALDLGCYGVIWPRVATVEQARNAVAACRYPRLTSVQGGPVAGLRGDGPAAAARYWGLSQQEYYRRADVWPLNPDGEILVVIMIESQQGIENLSSILEEVPGIGLILIGEGDMSQELGIPRQYDHPLLLNTMDKVLDIGARFGVPVGHPHVTARNAEFVIARGYKFLLTQPTVSWADFEAARGLR